MCAYLFVVVNNMRMYTENMCGIERYTMSLWKAHIQSRASVVHKSDEEDRPSPHRSRFPNHLVNGKINMFNITHCALLMLAYGWL